MAEGVGPKAAALRLREEDRDEAAVSAFVVGDLGLRLGEHLANGFGCFMPEVNVDGLA